MIKLIFKLSQNPTYYLCGAFFTGGIALGAYPHDPAHACYFLFCCILFCIGRVT